MEKIITIEFYPAVDILKRAWRPKKILEHTSSLPKETMVTYDFKRFRNPYDEDELIAVL